MRELEGALADAHSTIARLEGKEPSVLLPREIDWRTGAPLQLVLERALDIELDDRTSEAVAEMMRVRLPNASVSQVGTALVAKTLAAELRIGRAENGGSLARLLHDPKHALVGMLTLVLLAAVFVCFPLAMYTAGFLAPPLWIASMVLTLLASVAGARALVARAQNRERQSLVGAFEAMVALARERGLPAKKTRIAVEPPAAAGEAETEAETEAERRAVRGA